MSRIARFARNVGWRGTIRTLLITVAFIFLLFVANPKDLEFAVGVPLAIAGFVLVYPLRNLLVLNLRLTQILLGVAAIVIVGSAFVFGKVLKEVPKENPWILTALVAATGVYMGAYFWLHSDPRIERVEE